MKTSRLLPALLSLALSIPSTLAKPFPPLAGSSSHHNATLELRNCPVVCGYYDQLCCAADQACTTVNDQASCAPGSGSGEATAPAGGNYQMYTTTYVEVDSTTVTSTGSYLLSALVQTPVASPGTGGCASGEQQCGSICCAYDQVCGGSGQCISASTGYITASASQSAFVRPTSNAVATITNAATTTLPFTAPINSAGANITATPQNSGLSAGAIAGIVIGVLIGLFVLFLILACLCCKGIIDSIMALFGMGKKKRRVEETTIIESRHSRHGSNRPPAVRRTWWGGQRPVRSETVEKKSSPFGGLLGVGGVLAAIAVVLGLKRRHDRKQQEKYESEYTASYYSYDDYSTSQSSASTRGPPRSHRSAPRSQRSVGRTSRR